MEVGCAGCGKGVSSEGMEVGCGKGESSEGVEVGCVWRWNG